MTDDIITDCETCGAVERIAELEAENEKLRAALKPFALAADDLDDGETGSIWERPCAMDITCDDLRAAKAALGESDE